MDVLKNKSYLSYDNISRYSEVPYYYHDVDKKYIYGITSPLDINTNYSTYKIQAGDTLDSLALKFYKNPTYFWVIADFNGIQDAFIKLRPGALIRVPVLSNIKFEG